MTEHDTKELERQYRAAVSRKEQAGVEANAAFNRWKDSILADTGLKGHLVQGSRQDGQPVYKFLAEKVVGYRNDELAGRVLKNDGTLGVRTIDMKISRLKDLGPFEGRSK